ncbi:hypothetical protein GQ457_13G010100 [Hibiscus cannabinus]
MVLKPWSQYRYSGALSILDFGSGILGLCGLNIHVAVRRKRQSREIKIFNDGEIKIVKVEQRLSIYWLDIPFCEAIGLKGVNGTKHIFSIPKSEWNKSHIERCTIMHIFSI